VNIYYHVTVKENELEIFNKGLIPGKGKRSLLINEDRNAIYLFKNESAMEDALMNWLGEELEEKELVILEIKLPETFPIEENPNSYEAISYEIIDPKYIRVYKYE
tara:strand:- start:11310 stop:11624 length:315 start_codon:yes stop_codon:yes gene_type:complete